MKDVIVSLQWNDATRTEKKTIGRYPTMSIFGSLTTGSKPNVMSGPQIPRDLVALLRLAAPLSDCVSALP